MNWLSDLIKNFDWNLLFAGMSCIFAGLTFIIALKLYDRYGIKGKVKSNRIDEVFELLNLLKKRTITISGSDNVDVKNNGKRVYGFLEFGENKSLKIFGMENYQLYFDQETYLCLSIKLESLLNSLWMPKEIKESMKFILNCGTDIIDNDKMNKEHVIIKFHYTNDNKGKVIPVTKFKNYEEFRLAYEKSMSEINIWLKKNNIDIKF